MTHKQLTQLVDAIIAQVRGYIAEQLDARDKRVEELQLRVSELESRLADPQKALPLGPRRVA